MTTSFEHTFQYPSPHSNNSTSSSSRLMSGLTPIKPSTGSALTSMGTTGTVKADLQATITVLYEDVSVCDFVETVWGLGAEKAKTILNATFQLDKEGLKSYRNVLEPSSGLDEKELHFPFRQISTELLKSAYKLFSIDPNTIDTCFWDAKGEVFLCSEPINDEAKRLRKPDMLHVFIPTGEDGKPTIEPDYQLKSREKGEPRPKPIFLPSWAQARAPVEFKKGTRHRLKSPTATSSNPGGTHKRGRSLLNSMTSATTSALTLSTSGEKTGSKRAGSPSMHEDNHPRKVRKMTLEQSQLAGYALECFYAGNRHYVTGIFIDGFRVKLWYYDRSAALSTVAFDFSASDGAAKLALLLFGLSQCNMKHAGFDPYVYNFVHPKDGQPIQRSDVTPIQRSDITPITTLEADKKKEADRKKVCYKFPGSSPDGDQIFSIKKRIFQNTGVNGRGTMVAEVQRGFVGKTLSKELYVLKLSWQHTARQHEGEIITKLRKALPAAWHDHLPDPVFYTKFTSEDLGLPRINLVSDIRLNPDTISPDAHERDLHVFATNRYKNIWQAKDVEEFKRIFLDCLECHFHTYNTGRVLHRDISENNLMIYQPGETDRDSSILEGEMQKPSRGIVNDFDLAATFREDGSIASTPQPQHHITGTLPFMARDLLEPNAHPLAPSPPKVHLYRYDLESFFYILIWAAIRYDLKAGKRLALRVGSLLQEWSSLEGKVAFSAKLALYAQRRPFDSLEPDVGTEWQGLWSEWIEPLRSMFRKGFNAASDASEVMDEEFDDVTCGGHITFEKFMATIKVAPRPFNPDSKE